MFWDMNSLSCKNWLTSKNPVYRTFSCGVVGQRFGSNLLVCLHVTMLTCAMSVYTLSKYVAFLSLVSDKMDRGALIEILGEIANNDAQTVKKELNDFVVSLRAQMQEVGPKDMEKVRVYSPYIKRTGKAVTLCIK